MCLVPLLLLTHGCTNAVPPVPPSVYVYQWKEGGIESWTIYEVTSAPGREQIRAWMVEHSEALRHGDAMAAQLAWQPRDLLVEVRPEAAAVEKHYLLRSYPVSTTQPKRDREYKVNLSDKDISELREIFRKYGLISQKSYDEVNGG